MDSTTKVIQLGYPYYSKNIISVDNNSFTISDLQLKNRKQIIIYLLAFSSSASLALLLSPNLALLTSNVSIPLGVTSGSWIQDAIQSQYWQYEQYHNVAPTRYAKNPVVFGFYTVLGFLASRQLGAYLLLPPSTAISLGYFLGWTTYYILNNF